MSDYAFEINVKVNEEVAEPMVQKYLDQLFAGVPELRKVPDAENTMAKMKASVKQALSKKEFNIKIGKDIEVPDVVKIINAHVNGLLNSMVGFVLVMEALDKDGKADAIVQSWIKQHLAFDVVVDGDGAK